MSNYTRPNDPDHQDDPQDWLSGALIFGRALSLMLRDREGIVVDISGDAVLSTDPDAKKVIVFSEDSKINILPCYEEFEEGQMIWMDEDSESESEDFPYDINPN
jgi:hypothetical protein